MSKYRVLKLVFYVTSAKPRFARVVSRVFLSHGNDAKCRNFKSHFFIVLMRLQVSEFIYHAFKMDF